MQIVGSVVIDCHIEDVFDYVADPLNDPAWRTTIVLVDQVEGEGPALGARYEMLQRSIRVRPPRHVTSTCTAWEPPARIAWRREAGGDVVDVTYALEPVWTATRMTQRHEHRWDAPPILRQVVRNARSRAVVRELRALRRLLERS